MATIKQNPITGKFEVTFEHIDEILAMSIQLRPGFSCRSYSKEDIFDVKIPTEDELPEGTYALNNGVYIFRYSGEVYINYGITPPGKRVETYVPMSNGESFVSYALEAAWRQRVSFGQNSY